MHVELGRPLAAPSQHTATHVLVFDDYGQPVIVIYEYAGSMVLSKAGDPDFANVLKNFSLQPANIAKVDASAYVRP